MSVLTKDLDLAAALLASGVQLTDVQTQDGVIAEFCLADTYGPGLRQSTEDAIALYRKGELLVSGSDVGKQRRILITMVRRALDAYKSDRREELRRDRA